MAQTTLSIRCVIVTPQGQIADQPADFVVLTAYDGQYGILPGRAPLLCKLAPGVLRIDEGRRSGLYFVAEGFSEVADDTVTVVTAQAIPADKLDKTETERELQEALALPGKSAEESDRRNRAIRVAQAKQNTLRLYAEKSK
jgi:F-type H+-transporting ATPase subunit epsilon